MTTTATSTSDVTLRALARLENFGHEVVDIKDGDCSPRKVLVALDRVYVHDARSMFDTQTTAEQGAECVEEVVSGFDSQRL